MSGTFVPAKTRVADEIRRNWRAFRLVFGLAGLLLIVGIGLVLFGEGTIESIGSDLIGSSMIGLAFAFVGAALDRRNAERARAQAARDRVVQLTLVLRSRVQNAQALIPTHKSAKTYGEQMRALTSDGNRFVDEIGALLPSVELLAPDQAKVAASLGQVKAYLTKMWAEYEAHYREAANAQERKGTDAAWSVLSSNETFPLLVDLLDSGVAYKAGLADPLEDVVLVVHTPV